MEGRHYHELSEELAEEGRALRSHIPEVYSAFGSLHRSAYGEGALSAKMKELIALALAVADQCDGCIASHASKAARRGATEEEVAETLGVTIAMMGGPGTVWAPRAFRAFREFSTSEDPPRQP